MIVSRLQFVITFSIKKNWTDKLSTKQRLVSTKQRLTDNKQDSQSTDKTKDLQTNWTDSHLTDKTNNQHINKDSQSTNKTDFLSTNEQGPTINKKDKCSQSTNGKMANQQTHIKDDHPFNKWNNTNNQKCNKTNCNQ